MEEPTVTVQARIDPALAVEFEATVKREERTKQTIIERALRAYIAASKAAEVPAPAAQPEGAAS